ncbi:hypothetical protein T484DRAFT_1880884, partial [Baffinella frigidus]
MFRNSVRQTFEADVSLGEVGILTGAGAPSSDAPPFSPDNLAKRPLPSTPQVPEGGLETTPEPPGNGRGGVVTRIGTTPPGSRRLYNVFEPELAQVGAGASPGADGRAGGMKGWLHKRRDHLPGTLRRWFTLEGGELSYFLSDRDPVPRKVYDVRGCGVAVSTITSTEPFSGPGWSLLGVGGDAVNPAQTGEVFLTLSLPPGPRTPLGASLAQGHTPRGRKSSGEMVSVSAGSEKELLAWMK